MIEWELIWLSLHPSLAQMSESGKMQTVSQGNRDLLASQPCIIVPSPQVPSTVLLLFKNSTLLAFTTTSICWSIEASPHCHGP